MTVEWTLVGLIALMVFTGVGQFVYFHHRVWAQNAQFIEDWYIKAAYYESSHARFSVLETKGLPVEAEFLVKTLLAHDTANRASCLKYAREFTLRIPKPLRRYYIKINRVV